ncbi:MAG: hypothetical protein ACYDAZ_05015 [Thermoplasmataceae archaeon]
MAVRVSDDYSEVLAYLANLFALKRIPSITLDRYTITYRSCSVMNRKEKTIIREFPKKSEVDRIVSIELGITVDGIEEDYSMKITWEYVEIIPEMDSAIMQDFLSMLDRSTFRYF